MHPLVSVSDSVAGADALHGAFYCIEGDSVALRFAKSIVRDLNGTSFTIKPESKALYHAAAVMASPHLVALFDLASEMLIVCGLKGKRARQILLPLVESTLKNLKTREPAKALTGTFARGDLATVNRHLKALRLERLGEAYEVYRQLGKHSLALAERNGLDPELARQIDKLLEPTLHTRKRSDK